MLKSYSSSQIIEDLKTSDGTFTLYSLPKLAKSGWKDINRLPYSIRVLLENALRNCDGQKVTVTDIERIAGWSPKSKALKEIAYKPARVLLQDFTGVPCIVDLAAMRDCMREINGDFQKINPQIPCDLIIDHSVSVDCYGQRTAFRKNLELDFKRNKERYRFLKWAQDSFEHFRVIPPATGIIHQINLEYLAQGVMTSQKDEKIIAYPDTLIGTDSHTTMINGLGILGWGVGGIEAEAVMLGEPINMLLPEVVGFRLTGALRKNITATDCVLTIVDILRKQGVVGKFVEFFGPGLRSLSLADRATISNMAPEYGATLGFFPIDEETLHYYRMTGRSPQQIELIERYMKQQELFYQPKHNNISYSQIIDFDLESVDISLAGPKRPQDRIPVSDMDSSFKKSLLSTDSKEGFGLSQNDIEKSIPIDKKGKERLTHGMVVLASITSCTNTSNPELLIGAALLAKKAIEKGLKVKKYIKTSLAPGSGVATEYLKKARLMTYLEQLGFHLAGYGCMTCIGNSGPLPPEVQKAIEKGNLVAASVISGNRNFEGRISPFIKANYLASPILVIAYALAGTVQIDLLRDPIGNNSKGEAVYLKDIWPQQKDIKKVLKNSLSPVMFKSRYKKALKGTRHWNKIKSDSQDLYRWDQKSTYIQKPPFFESFSKEINPIQEIQDAHALLILGDSITTDHISPAGPISMDSPAGRYLLDHHVKYTDFNTYGSRRGNDRIMTRGTFANIRLRNQLTPEKEGSWTKCFVNNREMSVFDAAELYRKNNIPLIVIAGKDYGCGSSRDWAAKGTALLGVKAVLAQSFERIHRSNLIGMGVLPVQFKNNDSVDSLSIRGDERFSFQGLHDKMKPGSWLTIKVESESGRKREFEVICRLDTKGEIEYYRNKGILQTVIRKML